MLYLRATLRPSNGCCGRWASTVEPPARRVQEMHTLSVRDAFAALVVTDHTYTEAPLWLLMSPAPMRSDEQQPPVSQPALHGARPRTASCRPLQPRGTTHTRTWWCDDPGGRTPELRHPDRLAQILLMDGHGLRVGGLAAVKFADDPLECLYGLGTEGHGASLLLLCFLLLERGKLPSGKVGVEDVRILLRHSTRAFSGR